MTAPPALSQPAPAEDTQVMPRLRAEIARMAEQFAACWITPGPAVPGAAGGRGRHIDGLFMPKRAHEAAR